MALWCCGGGFYSGCVGFLWVLVCVSGSGFVVGWSVLLMGLWFLLVIDGFVGFVSGWWLVVAGFLWDLLGQIAGFVGSIL